MQGNTFLIQKLREKFLIQELSEINAALPQSILNIEDKTRSNIFTWRGQFSPQLIENLLLSYCPKDAKILDPFAGSGTVLYEAACLGLSAFGCEVNPAAWILSRTYQLINLQLEERENLIISTIESFENYFPKDKTFDNFSCELDISEFEITLFKLYERINSLEKIIIETFVILLDLANNKLTMKHIHATFYKLCQVIKNFPYSQAPLNSLLCDARCLPIDAGSIDFVVTSPPYINVFNYHQNYRRSAETLGWDLLKIAKSEIGSNRANRGNRFLTVIQYCLDMALVLRELQKVCKDDGKVIFVIGQESNVLGVPFYNAEIISDLAAKSNLFELSLVQKRTFKNKFGKLIRENLLNLTNKSSNLSVEDIDEISRNVAYKVLNNGLAVVSEQNKLALMEAIEKIPNLGKSPLYSYQATNYYQKSLSSFSTKETTMPQLPTPHYDKLIACLNNPRLPGVDKERVEEAVTMYRQWIQELEAVEQGQPDTVEKLVEATNQYKRFIELDLIFDSPDNFLYRQKGQLKLDNTILEEFLPQVIYRSLKGIDNSFEIGPKSTFSGLSFLSSLGNPGQGGEPTLRTKNQDFVLGKKLYLKTSFDSQFTNSKLIESHLGYVCAECKTNLDKTMFQEAVATSRDLKIAVPSSLYFLVCEFLDMTPVSITSTQIDDVLIVRKSRRISANIRQEYKTPESRKQYRQEYADFIDASKYYADVFQRMIDKIQTLVEDTAPGVAQVLRRGHF